MLIQLYYFLENLLLTTANDFGRLNYGQLNFYKWILLLGTLAVFVGVVWYGIRCFSRQIGSFIDGFIGTKSLGIFGWIQLMLQSFNELKLSMTILIFAFMLLSFVQSNYLGRRRAAFRDVFIFAFDGDNNGRNADLNVNDRQNVHNSTVTKHLVDSINKLLKKEEDNKVTPLPITQIYHEIRQYLISSTHEQSNKALDVLDYMNNLNGLHTSSGLREMEILRLVWQRMNHPVNENNLDDLKESILLQLADCKPNTVVMCVTGRVTRIIQSLQCVDAEGLVDLKPLWAIKEEIENYFTNYADKLIERMPENYQEAFNAINRTKDQEHLVDKFNKCLIKNLEKRFKLSYLDTKILTEKQLNDLTRPHYDNISELF